MKKIIGIAVMAGFLSLAHTSFAQDSTKDEGALRKAGHGIEKGAKKAGKGVKKGAVKAGNETAELASKGKAKLTDKKSDEWVGPEGQTIYIDDGTKYYWVNEKGGKVFVTREELRPKQKKDD